MLSLPLLARLYTPDQMAHYALLLGIGVVVSSFAGLRLDLAVPIPEEEKSSRQLFWLASLTPWITVPVMVLAGLVAVWHFDSPLGLGAVDALALAAFVLVTTFFTASTQLAIRLRIYGLLGRIPVYQAGTAVVAQLGLGVANIPGGLFLGGLVGRFVGVFSLYRSCQLRWSQRPSQRESRSLLRRYWRFPVIFAPASLVEVLGSNLTALILPILFGLGPAGLYAMAVRVAGAPGAVISYAAGQVFLGEFARAPSVGASLRVFFRWSLGLMFLAVASTMAIWIIAPILLPWILGTDWEGTVPLAQYAAIIVGAGVVGSPVQHVWTIRQRGLMQATWNITRLAATLGVLWWGAATNRTLTDTAAWLALATCLVYALGWAGCLWAAHRPNPTVGHHTGETLLDTNESVQDPIRWL